jgi:hypothetical protein
MNDWAEVYKAYAAEKARWDALVKETAAEFYLPRAKLQLAMKAATMPDEALALLDEAYPGDRQAIVSLFSGGA